MNTSVYYCLLVVDICSKFEFSLVEKFNDIVLIVNPNN